MFISEFIAGILSLVMLLTVFAYNSPILFFISVVIITVIWILILKNLNFFIDRLNLNTEKADRRKEALRIAKIYLSPYSNIWRGLKLSNKYCYLKLESDGVSIIGKEIYSKAKSSIKKMNTTVKDYLMQKIEYQTLCESDSTGEND